MFKPGLWLCSGIDPPDVQREKDGIGALQALEHKEDHSVDTCLLTLTSCLFMSHLVVLILVTKFDDGSRKIKIYFLNTHSCPI